MTTIAYKDGHISYDSRACRGDMIVNTPFNKRVTVNGFDFFFSGSPHRVDDFIDVFFNGGAYPDDEYGVAAFVVTPDADVLIASFRSNGQLIIDEVGQGEHMAIGSGGDFAIAAMDLGKSAKESVKYAATRDPFTGGPFKEYKV